MEYVKQHPKWINKERKLLIKNIVKPTLKRDDVFFDEEMYRNCLKYCEKYYYPLFPYQKFIYAFAFMFKDDIPLFGKFFVMMGRGNGKDGFIVPLANFFQTPLHGIKNYHVEIVANSEQQVKDTFKVAYDAMDIPGMKGKFRVTRELITNNATRSELKYKQAEDLDKIAQASINAYTGRANITEEKVKELLDNETWLTAQECLDMGFATEIKEVEEEKGVNQSAFMAIREKVLARPKIEYITKEVPTIDANALADTIVEKLKEKEIANIKESNWDSYFYGGK